MNLEETLLFYRNKLGLPVFPMQFSFDEAKQKVNKKPLIQWGKYMTELPTEERIKEWCNHYTGKNVGYGMPTGELSRIVVIDVDMDRLEEAEAILGTTLTSTMMVNSGRGGRHIYYRWEAEMRNTVKIEGAPIDFRGDGGYVVIPPSKSEWGGYSWVREPNEVLRMMLPEMPEQIKKLLTMNKTKVKIDLSSGQSDVYSDGERNAASVVAIRKLLGNMPQELWMTTGKYAFYHWCKTFCKPELDDVQIEATFSWWVRTNAQVIETAGRGKLEMSLERIEERKLEASAPTTGYPMLDAKIKGWVPGHLYVLTGETNAGKTACACNFLYRVFKQGKKATYFALEPDVGVVEYVAGIQHSKRWESITEEDLKAEMNGITFFTKDANMNLSKLVKTIETMPRQDLIIVDHIGYFTSDADSKLSQTQQESNAIKKIVSAAKKKKTAIMIIAHARKPQGANKKNLPITMNDISGSAAFKQDATDILILHMDKDLEASPAGLVNASTGALFLPKVKTGKSGQVPIRFIPDSPIMLDTSESDNVSVSEVYEMSPADAEGIFND